MKPANAGNAEPPTIATSIQEYSKTAAALAELAQRYKGVIFDVSTREGLATAIKGRAELRRYRLELEKTRVEIKAPALKRSQEIDSEARRITAELLALETPIDDQIKADERRKAAEAEAKAKAEADRIAAEEAARKAAEEKVLAAQRAEIARQQEELAAKQRAQAEADAAARRQLEEEQRAHRLKMEEEERVARQAREKSEAALAEITGIQHQVMIAQVGRAGVRQGGTIACIEETLAETEAWETAEERFGPFTKTAQIQKDKAVAQIKDLLAAAKAREAEDARIKDERDRLEAERRAAEDRDRKAREEEEAREKKKRDEQEAAERAERARIDAERRAAEDRQRHEREEKEAAEREARRKENEKLDGRAMLEAFVKQYGQLEEFAVVVAAIKKHLKAVKVPA